jgi:hypothetical protein
MTINELRKKTEDDKVAKRAKSLIKDWKSLLDAKKDKAATVGVLPRTDSLASNVGDEMSVSRSSSPPSAAPKQLPTVAVKVTVIATIVRMQSSMIVLVTVLVCPVEMLHLLQADDVRAKCRELLVSAMRCGELPDGTLDPEELAEDIEATLFELHRGTTDKYKVR